MADERKAVIIGIMSGMLPLAINLLGMPPEKIFSNFDIARFSGGVIQVLLLMLLGGFIVFVNKEINLYKAFQLGVAAPAIIVGLMNGQALKQSEYETKQLASPYAIENTSTKSASLMSTFISTAYADESSITNSYLRKTSTFKRFLYGLTGNLDASWFVIAGSHKTAKSANQQVKELKTKGYDAQVYKQFNGSQYFGVMIGTYLPLKEAKQLKAKAIKDNLSKDTYLWKWK